MTDIQGANTAGILAAGAAGVDAVDADVSSVDEDAQANEAIIDRIVGPGPVQESSGDAAD